MKKSTDISSLMEEDEEPPGGRTYKPLRTISPLSRSAAAINGRTNEFIKQFYPHITTAQWNDWHWQLKHRISTQEQLARIVPLAEEELTPGYNLPMSITPYYASLIRGRGPSSPLRRCVVPTSPELDVLPSEQTDPLHEEEDSPCLGIVHRYPDRVLFLVTDFCSVYCRYCTRSRLVGTGGSEPEEKNGGRDPGSVESIQIWQQGLQYIRNNPVIRDVLISGGDPLTLSDRTLEWLLSELRRIKHVEIIRIGTKAPMVLPMRITRELVRILSRFHPLWMSIHVTHPDELTEEAKTACTRLCDGGIPLGSQTVLLKGINDETDILKELFQKLLTFRVKPYYLYQCDPVPGTAHFRTPLGRGIELIDTIQGFTSGYAVPYFVVDAPGGGGKIPLFSNRMSNAGDGTVLLRNYEGKLFPYEEILCI